MSREARKAAIAAYKRRKPAPGVYAVCCRETGERWVGGAPDVEKMENRVRFMLSMGDIRPAALGAALARFGAEAFSFETLERIDSEDGGALKTSRLLKERVAAWRSRLGAAAM